MIIIIGSSLIAIAITAGVMLVTFGFWICMYEETFWYIIPAVFMTGVSIIVLYFDTVLYMKYVMPYFLGR